MELEKLIKQRDSYAGKILGLAIRIAVLFLVPAVLAILANTFLGAPLRYVFPLAFIISWTGVVLLYKKITHSHYEFRI